MEYPPVEIQAVATFLTTVQPRSSKKPIAGGRRRRPSNGSALRDTSADKRGRAIGRPRGIRIQRSVSAQSELNVADIANLKLQWAFAMPGGGHRRLSATGLLSPIAARIFTRWMRKALRTLGDRRRGLAHHL